MDLLSLYLDWHILLGIAMVLAGCIVLICLAFRPETKDQESQHIDVDLFRELVYWQQVRTTGEPGSSLRIVPYLSMLPPEDGDKYSREPLGIESLPGPDNGLTGVRVERFSDSELSRLSEVRRQVRVALAKLNTPAAHEELPVHFDWEPWDGPEAA